MHEEEVRRKSRNWDWNVLLAHRKQCKRYREVYRSKLTEKVTEQLTKQVAELERDLDAFNIILIRQQVENEVYFWACLIKST